MKSTLVFFAFLCILLLTMTIAARKAPGEEYNGETKERFQTEATKKAKEQYIMNPIPFFYHPNKVDDQEMDNTGKESVINPIPFFYHPKKVDGQEMDNARKESVINPIPFFYHPNKVDGQEMDNAGKEYVINPIPFFYHPKKIGST
ncbi:uncharacterized protein LOC120198781 isoform X3 [Hibiscus syriacus]|uniref:uncharacterized protein LOC120198781 isoform X3 n=1 Tax=Hibiscus syriacus TaxID=106335 RepID=UPI001921BA5E|nr:uncharacterized protein LOC120198781 isoform X3 [Hibiscus syriacus]